MSTRTTTSVAILDPHPLVRLGIRTQLEKDRGFEVVAEGTCERDLFDFVRKTDLVVFDIQLEDASGLSALESALSGGARARVLVVSALEETLYAERCVRAGASGFLHKSAAADRLLTAARRVMAGEIHLGERVLQAMARRIAGGGVVDDPLASLTARELEVFRMMADGVSSQAVADALHISLKTVETHQAKLRRKLGVRSILQLRKLAMTWRPNARGVASAG